MALIIGHRGAPGYRPEHTRSSYLLAVSQGVDAVEPDIVPTRDGVLVVRHENEISSTTDVGDRPEFANRRAVKQFAGHQVEGWFTEDFDADEIRQLRGRERIPDIRPESARGDGKEPVLLLREVLDIARESGIGVVVEIKHAPYFQSIGLDPCAMLACELRDAGWQGELAKKLVIESFEQSALTDMRSRGIDATYVYLLEKSGTALDLLLAEGDEAPTYRQQLSPGWLDRLATEVGGISVHKNLILAPDREGTATGPAQFVADARERELDVFVWTARPENRFLLPAFRTGGSAAEHGDWRSEWALLREAGVTGVFADHPDLAAEAFR
ncbi:glycerophosphodiester phosphodiesterase family protein [Microbacterium amylolyticum]|uniref:glycerophosphodiester phosphodiesterase n=1 Tax=Microbacterium amylolyticum TaxID=936337 RepID=A0ABS4ZJG6_9MICO|nr:glycerophosphodiester phosphodiesterase family protein [Microbacterium amylolyticum]MBP2437421.1 glycerophosphoryl diester phosphodiesterase [Microbacterium amylolyticum]